MSIYSVHPSIAYQQSIITNLKETTGRSIDDWKNLLSKKIWSNAKILAHHLKEDYNLGSTKANLISELVLEIGLEDILEEKYLAIVPQYIEKMFATRPIIFPLYENIIDHILQQKNETKISPCATIVPLYRNHVYAQIKPSTKTRIDLGFALKKYTKRTPIRLELTGGIEKGDRITHRIKLSSIDDFDSEAKEWLQIAYDLDF